MDTSCDQNTIPPKARVQTLPMKFACPSVVLRNGETNSGATESAQPWGDAVAEG